MTNYVDVFNSDLVPPSGYAYQSLAITGTTNPSFWPYNYTGTAIVISKIIDISLTGAATMQLPDATQVSPGEDMLIFNTSAYTLTIQSYTGSVVTTIAAGTSKYLYLKTNTTTAGTWGLVTYGTGTSSADASALAGSGLAAISSTLNAAMTTVAVSSYPQTLDTTHRAKVINCTSGSGTINLPTVASLSPNAGTYFVAIKNTGSGVLSITTTDSKTIDGTTTFTVRMLESAFFICDGTNWQTVGYGRSVQGYTLLTQSVSAGGTIALTAAQALNQLINFTGSPAAAVTVTIPNAVGIWYITNSSTQTVTFSGITGTGIAVYSGWSLVVRSDATNVYNANITGTQSGVIGENLLINPGLWVNQRLLGTTAATNNFIADRWYRYSSAANSNIYLYPNSVYGGTGRSLQFNRTVGDTTATTVVVAYAMSMEEVNRLLTQTVVSTPLGASPALTLSCQSFGSSSSNTISVTMGIYTSTVANQSASLLAQKLAAGTGGWVNQATFSQANISVVGGNFAPYSCTGAGPLGPSIQQVGVAFTITATGTAGATEFVIINAIKLERGTAWTQYVEPDYETELAKCQFYYEKSFQIATAPAQNAGNSGAAFFSQVVAGTVNQAVGAVTYKTRKRNTTGIITLYNPGASGVTGSQIRNVTGSTDWSSTSAGMVSETGFQLTATGAAASTAGSLAAIHWTADYEL